LKILKQYLDDEREPLVVRQTCQLAIAKIEHEISNSGRDGRIKRYGSIDPAPAFSLSPTDDTIEELKACLLDRNADLFLRYRAMFTLRDIGTAEAVLALAEGLKINGEDHALFRHEIAYIFGQMQHAASVPALKEALKCTSEAPMVRHECAEALGSIASDECLPVLDEFKSDQIDVVRDSCLVALDMWEYEQSGQFQYAFTPN
jgi:deoxyhypusine monooxygenase